MTTRERGGASMPCTRCGQPTSVMSTRLTGYVVTRDRECTGCTHRFKTEERVRDTLGEMIGRLTDGGSW